MTQPKTPAQPQATAAATASPLSRRGALVGAGAVGALAVVASRLSGGPEAAPTPVSSAKTAKDTDGGYRLSDHVQRYYQTAKV